MDKELIDKINEIVSSKINETNNQELKKELAKMNERIDQIQVDMFNSKEQVKEEVKEQIKEIKDEDLDF